MEAQSSGSIGIWRASTIRTRKMLRKSMIVTGLSFMGVPGWEMALERFVEMAPVRLAKTAVTARGIAGRRLAGTDAVGVARLVRRARAIAVRAGQPAETGHVRVGKVVAIVFSIAGHCYAATASAAVAKVVVTVQRIVRASAAMALVSPRYPRGVQWR